MNRTSNGLFFLLSGKEVLQQVDPPAKFIFRRYQADDNPVVVGKIIEKTGMDKKRACVQKIKTALFVIEMLRQGDKGVPAAFPQSEGVAHLCPQQGLIIADTL
jgi:hypothetical protein